jgi:glutamate/tyrosine decarboxylase-like PLP-dependent enzyme
VTARPVPLRGSSLIGAGSPYVLLRVTALSRARHTAAMAISVSDYDAALSRAAAHARTWLASLQERRVRPAMDADAVGQTVGGPLPDVGIDPEDVVDLLAKGIEPGLMAMGSGRFFGWVIGGTLPAALAADWMVSAWDQNAGMRYGSPGAAAVEEAAAAWLLDLLGLPAQSAVGFTTGGTMANWVGLLAGRHQVLQRVGWDVEADGLTGAPRVNVLVGDEEHSTVDLALRYLGLGRPKRIPADAQGRVRPDALREQLARVDGPTIVALQAGNLHSGAFDPFEECIDIAHDHGAWVHIDGAFGLWAGAVPRLAHLMTGAEQADSWATDAHKTLNVPYDCGVAIVRDAAVLTQAASVQASYLVASAVGDPYDRVPELSRRARGVPVWAALRSLGRSGVVELVDRLAVRAREIADGISRIPGAEILNDVVYTQVSVSFGSDARTEAITQTLLDEGITWMSGSHWQGRAVMRVSSSNWSTDPHDVATSVAAVRRAAASVLD